MQLLCFSRIWYLIMSIERSQAQAVTDVNLEALHDEVLRSCRGKQSRYFLEARCGVGATRSRDYMIRPVVLRDCEFCSSQSYLCLGMGCKGKNKKAAVLVSSQNLRGNRSKMFPNPSPENSQVKCTRPTPHHVGLPEILDQRSPIH